MVVSSGAAGAESAEQPIELQFDAVPSLQPIEIFGNAWSIYMNGLIDKDAPQRFAKLIAESDIRDASDVF